MFECPQSRNDNKRACEQAHKHTHTGGSWKLGWCGRSLRRAAAALDETMRQYSPVNNEVDMWLYNTGNFITGCHYRERIFERPYSRNDKHRACVSTHQHTRVSWKLGWCKRSLRRAAAALAEINGAIQALNHEVIRHVALQQQKLMGMGAHVRLSPNSWNCSWLATAFSVMVSNQVSGENNS